MMDVCINNNNQFNQNRPKRDFRFQVIEVCQGPKWFVWPSKNRSSSTEEIDENHNKDPKTTASSSKDFSSSCATQNGYGAMRRSVLRSSKRLAEGTEGSGPSPRTASEPASRRLSLKKDKAQTEPLSQPGSTFKILSIAKKWESFDATDEDEEEETELSASCQTLVLNH